MAEVKFKLPDVGEGIVEAEIVEWHVNAGDAIVEDQPVVSVMTDKATIEIPSPVEGKVVSTVGEAGDIVNVGSEIIVFETGAAGGAATGAKAKTNSAHPPNAEAAKAAAPKAAAKKATKPKSVEPSPVPASPAPASNVVALKSGGAKATASPAVRKRALDADIEISSVPGTGPAGRVGHQDLDDFMASGGRLVAAMGGGGAARAPQMGVEEQKIIGLRRKIATNMAQSYRSIPHFAYVEEVDVTALEELRQHLNATRYDGQPKLTILPFLVQALVKALPEFPDANAHFDEEAGVLTRFDAAHVGIATATPQGLFVPVIKHAESKDIWQCANEIKHLSTAARDGTASKEELSGSTITITSLGALGGIASTPIINAPEVGIIGVNKMVDRPMIVDGQLATRKIMNLSSSFDHRIVDGFVAASLVQRLKGLLEFPATIFM